MRGLLSWVVATLCNPCDQHTAGREKWRREDRPPPALTGERHDL